MGTYLPVRGKNKLKGILFRQWIPRMWLWRTIRSYTKSQKQDGLFHHQQDGKTGVKSSNYAVLVVPFEFKEVVYDRNGAFLVTGADDRKGIYFSQRYQNRRNV